MCCKLYGEEWIQELTGNTDFVQIFGKENNKIQLLLPLKMHTVSAHFLQYLLFYAVASLLSAPIRIEILRINLDTLTWPF